VRFDRSRQLVNRYLAVDVALRNCHRLSIDFRSFEMQRFKSPRNIVSTLSLKPVFSWAKLAQRDIFFFLQNDYGGRGASTEVISRIRRLMYAIGDSATLVSPEPPSRICDAVGRFRAARGTPGPSHRLRRREPFPGSLTLRANETKNRIHGTFGKIQGRLPEGWLATGLKV